jgi:hypothetical protein
MINSIESQVATLLIESADGKYAVCLDPNARFKFWIMYRHADGHWVSHRPAFPVEIEAAKRQLQNLKVALDIPTKG